MFGNGADSVNLTRRQNHLAGGPAKERPVCRSSHELSTPALSRLRALNKSLWAAATCLAAVLGESSQNEPTRQKQTKNFSAGVLGKPGKISSTRLYALQNQLGQPEADGE